MMQLNKKVDINLGYRCNVACKFCYYSPFLRSKFFNLNLIKKQLRASKRLGIEKIDLTGGEPTMNKNLISIVAYALSLGFKKVCLITNGILLADIKFFKALKEAGVSDILFSIHGDNAESHDYIMGAKGSFEKCLKAIENAGILGVRIRINSVITQFNYQRLPDIARLIRGIGPEVVSLINLNPCVCHEIYNKDLAPMLKKAAPYVKEAVDILKDRIKVNVMYIPFCLMEGYERYIHNMHQIQYDPEEWDYLKRAVIQNGLFSTIGFIILRGMRRMSIHSLKLFPVSEFLHRMQIKAICGRYSTMFPECKKCRYYFICDGPWRRYAALYGGDEFKPIKGEKITEPYFFMQKEYSC